MRVESALHTAQRNLFCREITVIAAFVVLRAGKLKFRKG